MKNLSETIDIAYILQNILGCKWTRHVFGEVRRGLTRLGELVRSADGLTRKVFNERLVKLVRCGILEKTSFPEVPPRVEYELTAFGQRFSNLLDGIDRLQAECEPLKHREAFCSGRPQALRYFASNLEPEGFRLTAKTSVTRLPKPSRRCP